MTIKRSLAAATFGAAAALTAAFMPTANAEMKHEGVTVNILTRPGPVIAGRLEQRGEEFKAMTGATIEVATVPFADLFQKLLTDWSTGTNSIDVGVFASGWAVELADSDLLADLSDFVANDPGLMFDDIAPYFREFNQKIDGKTYLITVDGDFHMMYYRTDVLEKNGLEPPDTWDEYLEVAAAVHGQDMNGDGEADYGSCLFKKRNAQSFWLILSVAGAFLQSQGTGQGIFFDTETMEPLVRNEGFKEALRIPQGDRQVRPAGRAQPGRDGHPANRPLRALRAAPRMGGHRPALDRPHPVEDRRARRLQDPPGSRRVVDRATQAHGLHARALPARDRRRQPHPVRRVRRLVGSGEREGRPKVIAAAYDFLSYMNRAGAVQLRRDAGLDGLQPVPRLAVREHPAVGRRGLLAGVGGELPRGHRAEPQQPEHGLRPPHPGTQQYEGICLDREIARFLAGEITDEQTMDNIYECWEEVTEDFGRERQAALYRASLGITN